MSGKKKGKKIRYAVVGLGHISQVAVLPAFVNAKNNSQLVALISSDEEKLKVLAKKYKVPLTYHYDQLEECLKSGEVDVLYVATPNHLHRINTEMAARNKVHVLCEKPMAVSPNDCMHMEKMARDNKVKLMIAYRLHFESANLQAIKLSHDGSIGDLKFFTSNFSFQVNDKKNIRLNSPEIGGGAIYDIGIYCINAARYLFKSEPVEVTAIAAKNRDSRFSKCDETTSVILRFPEGKLATFTVSFGSYDSSEYEIVGSRGSIRLENAYDYAQAMKLKLFQEGKKEVIIKFKKRDQFSSELLYFSNCIQKNITPEPGGSEGLADIKIISSILRSLETGRAVSLGPVKITLRPDKQQEIIRPAIRKIKSFHASSPSKH